MPDPSPLVRTYQFIDRIYTRVAGAMGALHQGFWLGLLTRRHLDQATASYYRSAGKYLDETYNTQGLLEWESRIVEEFFADCRTILVGAAGGGREVIALQERGFQVAAFECSDELADRCRSLAEAKGQSLDVAVAAPGQVPAVDQVFDGTIVGWGGYMHIVGRPSRVQFLKALQAKVKPGGPLLVSFFTRNPETRSFRWTRSIAAVVRRLRLSSEMVELGDTIAGSFDHHFTREEIESELEECGFRIAHTSDRPYGHAVGIAVEDP